MTKSLNPPDPTLTRGKRLASDIPYMAVVPPGDSWAREGSV
jgi:hypothetical protein